MPDPFPDRRARLRLAMAQHDPPLDAVLITHLTNVRYLSGFTGSNAAILVTPTNAAVATDIRYQDQAVAQCGDVPVIVGRDLPALLISNLDDYHRQRAGSSLLLGFEADHVSVAERARWDSLAKVPSLHPVLKLVEALRANKDADEIAAIIVACEISVAALERLLPTIRVGQSEIEIGLRLEILMRELGAQDRSFETIVAGGENSAIPHHHPSSRPLTTGDLLKIDFGALVDGYHADCTRTFVLGVPADWQREIHELVRAAQQAGRLAMVGGADRLEVDAAARELIAAAGYGDKFGHGLGHGVGLDIHEEPFIGPSLTGTLDVGTPLTCEPGIYLVGRGGVRIEDTLLVSPVPTDSGQVQPRVLTETSRELLVLG